MRASSASIFSLALALGGCADGFSSDASALVVGNGENLNGQNLNGQNLNGENLNGSELGRAVTWVAYYGAHLDGWWVDWLWLEGSELVGWQDGLIEGGELAGLRLAARSDTGLDVALRITDVEPPAPGDDRWRYWVEYREVDGTWLPICEDATGVEPAYALDGWWDPRQGHAKGGRKTVDHLRFTFACPRLGALGKCVDAGYAPWAHDAHHQACVRLMRADYCGDGTPHTVDGTLVNLYDDIGIQADTDDWVIEAEWDEHGARCVSPHSRGAEALTCHDVKSLQTCGEFRQGTLLISETPEAAP